MEKEKKTTSKRKKKSDVETLPSVEDIKIEIQEPPPIKKRGRKPKGGKILENFNLNIGNEVVLPNVIIHLKCSLKDLEEKNNEIQSYNNNESMFEIIEKNFVNSSNCVNIVNSSLEEGEDLQKKELNKKLKELEVMLHLNDTNFNRSAACFWCTESFDNSAFFIPKHYIRNGYEVYGCFCSPECSCAYLMNEHIDVTTKFERYHLLNNIYGKINNHQISIKPAPNPHYTLSKFNGNLSIEEYRSLFKLGRTFLVVDKPLTKILPELHEDNDDFIINNKSIPSSTYNIKKKPFKKTNKNDIINDKFGLV